MGRIGTTVEYFIDTFSSEINLKLVLITSEKEYLYNSRASNTILLCKEMAEKSNGQVLHYHYPKVDGRMSHQLNWGIKCLNDLMTDSSMIAIYNADSKPHPETFKYILSKKSADTSLNVFQQYGDYTKNINSKTNSILLSAALWQNRWALGFELFKAVKSLGSYKNSYLRPLNYLIGHGLIISKSVYDKSIGFSEIFHNEDAILGLEISFIKEKITPLPYFDISDTPDTVMSLYKQKIHWFFGPFQAFKYFKYLNKKYGESSFKERGVLLFQSYKLFLHAKYWIFGPAFIFLILLYPLAVNRLDLFITAYSTFLIYFSLPNLLALNFSVVKNDRKKLPSLPHSILWGGIICYFLHGLSAISAVALSIKNQITGKPIAKNKTIMKTA